MNKIVSTKNTSSIFLATLLILGTFAAISPSFMVGAQAAPGYGMEKEYGSYEEPEYGSYEQPEYRMDSYDKKSYGNDDYKSQYSSYGKDNRDKSKDSNNVIVKKVKCNNINVNVNGLELNVLPPFLSDLLGSEAQASDEGYSGAFSYGSGSGSYGDGKSSSGKSFKFICINNNNNTNIVTDGGNVTDGGERDPCVECFRQVLNATAFADLEEILRDEGIITNIGGIEEEVLVEINSLEELCTILKNVTIRPLPTILSAVLGEADIVLTTEEFIELIDCIATAFGRV